MAKELLFGIQTNGIRHREADGMPDIDTRFAMVRETRVVTGGEAMGVLMQAGGGFAMSLKPRD